MHGFADAPEKMYGVYIRTIESNGKISSRLYYAKSHIAPLKSVTIPRIELNAAVSYHV